MSFALVAPLLLVLILGVTQLAVALWVRTTLIDAAVTGAYKFGAVGSRLSVVEDSVRESLASTLGADYVHSVSATTLPIATVNNGFADSEVRVVEVRLSAPVPLVGLFGVGELSVVGHSMLEEGPE